MKRNKYLDGIFGLVVGDALGVPVEFKSREQLKAEPVIDMREYGTYHLPRGTWSDDSSMTLATLDSLINGYNLEDIMDRFVMWWLEKEYTPLGKLFDIGGTTNTAVKKYMLTCDLEICGCESEDDNGNGSLMRILPICIYLSEERMDLPECEKVHIVHQVSGLTHKHIRSKIACGLYFFCVKSILGSRKKLYQKLNEGIREGMKFYERNPMYRDELCHFVRLTDLNVFSSFGETEIRSTGYVVDSLEAAIWCVSTSASFRECVLKAVNLGGDTDTVAAIAGGLAGLEYGYDDIPKEWRDVIARKGWIYELCCKMTN